METTMAVIQSFAVLYNIARLDNDPQPPDEIKNIEQLLSNKIVEIDHPIETTQPQNNSPAHTLRTALINEHFAHL